MAIETRLGRPRAASDEAMLAAVAAAIGRVGPTRLTLADVATEAGVTASAVAQRFGSKRNLLLSFVRSASMVGALHAAHAASREREPLARLIDAIVTTIAPGRTDPPPEVFANHLAFLHLDLADPEFRAILAQHDRQFQLALMTYLNGAHLVPDTNPDMLATALTALRHGAQ